MITTLVGAGLLVLLVVLMLLREWRTEVIILTATDYSLPAPLNPWAVEDGNALKELQQENLTPVTDITDKWSAQPNLATLLQLLEEEIEETKAPLIVYISMHGIVNDERMPCLLPPGVRPAETTKLIPVRRILEHISQLAAANRRDALVILDCNRFRANWNLGIVYNTFTERLQEVLKANPVSNVAVLCSAGPGQVNWASADLQGSSFGRYLQLGLAGAADSGESANGDEAVSLHELVAYLQREVNAWSEFNRGEPQKPSLVSGEAEDFHVAYNVRDSQSPEGLVSKFYGQKRAEPEKRSEIAALWAQLDKLRTQGLLRQDPLACRDLEFSLLRLEELWQGGSAYRQSAEYELTLLQDKLSRAVEQKEAVADSRSVSDHLGLGTIGVAAHTLPMAEYFGTCDAQLAERIGRLWRDPARLAGDRAPLESATDEPELETARQLAEMQLLLAARDQGVNSLWQSPDALTSALKLRDRAEQLAVPRGAKGLPGDERAHYFARHALNAADERRRLVEDALFIGPRSGQGFAELMTEAVELYDTASEVMQEATAAYTVRDAAFAEAPYLGWWLCGPANLEIPDRKALIDELIELIRQSRALNQAITSPEKLGEAGASPEPSGLAFQHLTSAALKHHQALKEAFKRVCEDLLGAGSQGTAGWTALDSALTTPLIPASQRGELLAKRDDVAEQLFSRYSETKQAADNAPAGNDTGERNSAVGSDSSATYLEAMQSWDSHPLVEILPGKNLESAKLNLDWCDAVAKHVRGRLARLATDEDDGAGATGRAGDDIFADRQRLSRAESELRASASLGFGLGGFKVDPIIALREFDLRALLAWHGERAMEDFWGDETGLDDPFFVRAAKHYFDAASNLGTPTQAFQPHIRGLQERLAQREKAKRERVQLQATPKLVDEESGDVEVQIDVSPTRASYPAGQAAIYLRNEESRQRFKIEPASAADTVLQYPPRSESESYAIAIRSAPRDQPRAEAVSFFRGQEVTDPFEMPTFEGVRIVYAPHNYVSQTITLSGDDPEQLSLVFILDCSNSMAAESKIQAERPETLQRLVLAENALITMLRDIADRNAAGERTRVGIRFFGHRLAWSTTDLRPPPPGWTSKLLSKDKYPGRKPEKPHPAVDVELVQPLGEFDDGVASDIATLLESVDPHGETPLYLALLLALNDFNSDNPLTRKSIIAITDGQDYQFPHRDFPPPVKITLDRLRTEWEGRGDKKIPVHILGFDIAPEESAMAQTEYKEVARFSGGSYTKIGSGRELLEHLRAHLNVDGYTVNALPLDTTNQSPPQPVKLGTPVEISNIPLPNDFQVQFRDVRKPVRLEGGEAIELHVEKKGAAPDIVAHNYNGRSPLPEVTFLTNGAGGQSEYILRAHLPVRRQGSENVVEFPISLQRDTNASHFTFRPAEVWLEITPLSVDGAGQTKPQQPYVFYDTNFEPYEPVPVVVCPTMDWRNWPKAQIKFWCKYRRTEAVLRIGLRDATYRTPQTVPDVNGVQIRVETSPPSTSSGVYRVYVAEKHSAESPGVGDALRVQFLTHPDCKPLRVRHQFDSDAGLATHSFEFQESDRETIENYDGSQIFVTLARDIKDGALQLAADSAIEVPVQPAGGYHTTGAVSTGR
ncbi:MAG TPA: hypothetical protein VJ828_14020 [Lacipirellulaceae bacterium]|nr:hypothetical protein [Lacipirellulaceae bacterium]